MEILARSVAVMALLFGLPPSIFLAIAAETGRGHLLGVVGLLLSATLIVLMYTKPRRAIAPGAAAFLLFVGLAFTIPANGPSPGFESAPIDAGFWQLLPEIDQIKLGVAIIPVMDPFIDRDQAKRLEDVTLAIYREIPDHPRSALAYGFGELFGGQPKDDHMYWSRPERDGAPVLIFLHGSAGNFASYPRMFSALDAVVVCPTLGFGMYINEERTRAAVDRARRFAIDELGGDPSRVFLAGISQGGDGVMQSGWDADWAKGVILISPVMDSYTLGRWRGPPIHVLHGAKDRRIPLRYVKQHVDYTKSTTITATYYPDEDHFLLYSKREEMLTAIAAFMADPRNPPTSPAEN